MRGSSATPSSPSSRRIDDGAARGDAAVVTEPRPTLGALLYRHRGLVPVLPIVYALWAADPHRPWVMAGATLMALGEALRLWAAAHLGKTARSSRPRATKLVTRGPYAHTRHPLYWANFALTMGFTLMSGAGRPWFPPVVGLGFLALYVGHARREERALGAAFPAEAAAYRAAVPGWRWRLRAARAEEAGETGRPGLRKALAVEALTLNAELWLLLALWVRSRFPPA
jgi:protein-S-isoprenylcysteine O-methyltransferase Ste14